MITKKAAIAAMAGSLLAGPVALTAMAQPGNAAVAVAADDRLTPGEWLLSGQSLTSVGGRFKLVQQSQGNLVFYDGTKALWTSPTAGNPGAKATMQKEGNLVIYSASNKALWSTPTAGNPGAYLLLPKQSGNLVIYSKDNKPLWSSKAYLGGKLPSGGRAAGRPVDPVGQRALQADPAGGGQRGPVRRAAQPVHHADGRAPGRPLDHAGRGQLGGGRP
ncbi:hypothetical protein GCM10020220_034780 [Nonomuraea rubra]|uniref:hypothetical protein n=1 Tax=Nonomuraea rubra TaxID=46180 RepID=UPI0031F0EF0A